MARDSSARAGKISDLTVASEPLRLFLARFFRARVRDRAEIDDLVQEVLTRILARDAAEPVQHLAAYAQRTAQSVLADRARARFSRRAAEHVDFDPARHGATDPGPEQAMVARDDLRVAAAALRAMPERTRTVFVLFRLQGLRQKEIALRLGISVSAVEKHLVRGAELLASYFEDLP